jgi:hypothetical protein
MLPVLEQGVAQNGAQLVFAGHGLVERRAGASASA